MWFRLLVYASPSVSLKVAPLPKGSAARQFSCAASTSPRANSSHSTSGTPSPLVSAPPGIIENGQTSESSRPPWATSRMSKSSFGVKEIDTLPDS
jgi:hypothetical protein